MEQPSVLLFSLTKKCYTCMNPIANHIAHSNDFQNYKNTNIFKETLDKNNIIPQLFQKSQDFCTVRSVEMGNNSMLSFIFWIDLISEKYEYLQHLPYLKVDFNKYTVQQPMKHKISPKLKCIGLLRLKSIHPLCKNLEKCTIWGV